MLSTSSSMESSQDDRSESSSSSSPEIDHSPPSKVTENENPIQRKAQKRKLFFNETLFEKTPMRHTSKIAVSKTSFREASDNAATNLSCPPGPKEAPNEHLGLAAESNQKTSCDKAEKAEADSSQPDLISRTKESSASPVNVHSTRSSSGDQSISSNKNESIDSYIGDASGSKMEVSLTQLSIKAPLSESLSRVSPESRRLRHSPSRSSPTQSALDTQPSPVETPGSAQIKMSSPQRSPAKNPRRSNPIRTLKSCTRNTSLNTRHKRRRIRQNLT